MSIFKKSAIGLAALAVTTGSIAGAAAAAAPAAPVHGSVVAGPQLGESDELFGLPLLLLIFAALAATVATVVVLNDDGASA